MFRWACFGIAVLFGMGMLALLYDLKRDVTSSLETARTAVTEANQAVTTVNSRLPEILAEVKAGTEALSQVADDVELIRSVAGIQDDESKHNLRSLATYADEIQRVLTSEAADRNAMILIEEVLGSDLKEVETVEEFLVGLNKEMVSLILPLSKSRQEILYRATYSGPPRRKPYYIRLPDAEPVKLEDFIKQHHPESAALPVYEAQ